MTLPTEFKTLYPERAGDRPFQVDDLWRVPRVGKPASSPDGSLLAVPVRTFDMDTNRGQSRIWLVPTAGGEIRPLTASDYDSDEPVFSPDGRRVAFVRRSREPRRQSLLVIPVDGGEAEELVEMPLRLTDPKWLPDGSSLVFVSEVLKDSLDLEATRHEVKRRAGVKPEAFVTEDRLFRFWDHWLVNGEVPHLFLVNAATKQLRDLTPASTLWLGLMELQGHYDISPDGAELAFSGGYTDGPEELVRQSVFTVPVAGGKPTCLTEEVHAAYDPRYSPDGERLVYGMKTDPYFYADRVRLRVFVRSSGQHSSLAPDWDRSPSEWAFAADGRLWCTAEDDGRSGLFTLEDGEPRRLTACGSVSGVRPAPQPGAVFLNHQTLQSPTEVYRLELSSGELERLTAFTESALAGIRLGEVRESHFVGAEGETVQMFVVLPPGHKEGDRPPLVQVIHGGPHGISADSFHPRWNQQLFAAPGYVVASVNFQGSSSRGQDFAKRIQGAWGDRPYRDVMTATDLLVESGVVDGERLAAAGGSYGGYMVSWIGTQTDRFRCLVNHAGVFDLAAQYATDVTQGRSHSFGGEPWDGLEAIDRYSPARLTAGLTTPMLVLHGERDFRVPVTHGLACYNLLKAKGVPARLVYFTDENHWVLKPQNSRLWYREVLAWLERYLTR